MRTPSQEFWIYRSIRFQVRYHDIGHGIDEYRMIVWCSCSPYAFNSQLQKKMLNLTVFFLFLTPYVTINLPPSLNRDNTRYPSRVAFQYAH